MALILNIESATTSCSVSISRDGEILALTEQNSGYTHAENLTLFIEKAMLSAGVKITDLQAVAVSKGPGSYTGLRIGVSVAKGICYGLNKPLIALDTLKCLTRKFISSVPAPADSPLYCPMLDARRMEVYCALYDQQLNQVVPVQALIIDGNSFLEFFRGGRIFFFGDGAEKCRQLFEQNTNAVFFNGIFPSAAAMAPFAEEAFRLSRFENTAYFEPYYLKDFVAGPKGKGKQQN